MNNPILFCCECQCKVNPINVGGVIICTICQDKREKEYELLEEKCKSFEGSFNAITKSLECVDARENVLRRNIENAYSKAKIIYPEFGWDGFTQTPEIVVMALDCKIKELLATQDHHLKLLSEQENKISSLKNEISEIQGLYEENLDIWQRKYADRSEELERQVKRSAEGARKAEEREKRFRIAFKEKDNNIRYKCPACGNSTLRIDASGFLVCSLIGCKDPGRIHEIISQELIFETGNQVDGID